MKKTILIMVLVSLVFLVLTGTANPNKDELWKLRQLSKDPNSLVVMTRNVYVGGYIDRIMQEPNPSLIPFRVAESFQEVLLNNFYYRAEAIADEISSGQPHLVGLQEISTMYRQSPGDYLFGNPNQANDLVFDYLQILMDALAARGLEYEVSGIILNFDIEMPMFAGTNPYDLSHYDDMRLLDFDVVLNRKDVAVSNVTEQNYQYFIPFSGIPIKRGFVALDAGVGHKMYKFVSTHLESADVPIGDSTIRRLQAEELMGYLSNVTLPIIVVGDLNTEAPDGAAYQDFMANGYIDAWTRNLTRPEIPGFTFGHEPLLRNNEVNLTKRIDLILVKSHVDENGVHNIGPVFAYVVGDELSDRILFPDETYVWPSDHAGVIALLRIPVLGN
jgi:hypothetical protein